MLQAKLVFNVINACTLYCRSIVEACSEGHFNEMSAVSFGFQKCSCEGQNRNDKMVSNFLLVIRV